MSSFRPYPEYKNSGLEWLGDIPLHWNEMKINNFTSVVSRKNHPNEELLSVYRDYGVILKSSRDDNNNKAGEDLSTYKLVEVGNLVLNKMKTWQGSLGISKNRGIVSPAYITCEVKKELFDDRFLHYLLRSEKYIYEYNRLSYGVRTDQWDMRYDDFKNTRVFIPPKPEQTAIANFLDSKTSEIQDFIALKEKTIELLKERKTAIINQAVTKGLDPNVEMKDSGIEWLGEIPKHWEVKKIRFLGEAIIGITYSPNDLCSENEGVLVLRSSNVQDGKISYEDSKFVKTKIPRKRKTKVGDILICSRNGSLSLVGKNALIDENSADKTFGAFMTVFRSPNFEFLHYFFNSKSFKDQSGLFTTTTINQLTTGILNNIILAIPPTIEEQNENVIYLKKKLLDIDSSISLTHQEITLIKEFQQSLISDSVTGKIDVRDWEKSSKSNISESKEKLSLAEEESPPYDKPI